MSFAVHVLACSDGELTGGRRGLACLSMQVAAAPTTAAEASVCQDNVGRSRVGAIFRSGAGRLSWTRSSATQDASRR